MITKCSIDHSSKLSEEDESKLVLYVEKEIANIVM